MFSASQDAMRGLLKVFGLSQKYVGDKLLRIAINQWKPTALHVNHHAVALAEAVQDIQ
jgi:hypothetical protein